MVSRKFIRKTLTSFTIYLAAFTSCMLFYVYLNTINESNPGKVSLTQKLERRAEVRPHPSLPRKHLPNNETIMFLKVHKTGSSTLANIFSRFAATHKKIVHLPKKGWSFGYPRHYAPSSGLYTNPNFLVNHARFKRDTMEITFPRKSSTYVTLIRDPVTQWESAFYYYDFRKKLDISNETADPMLHFLNNQPLKSELPKILKKFHMLKNPTFWDLGFNYDKVSTGEKIKNAVKEVDRNFDLCLIMEYWDESITLLRRRLQWSIDDVLYFKQNERLDSQRHTLVGDSIHEKIEEWNRADAELYKYMLKRFWEEVKLEGEDFYKDLLELKQRLNEYRDLCVEKEQDVIFWGEMKVKGIKLRETLEGDLKVMCEHMDRTEVQFLDYFSKIQNTTNLEQSSKK